MLRVLTSILNLIVSLLNFIVNAFRSLVSILTSIPEYLDILTSVFSVMPPFIFPFIIMAVYTMIMLKWVLNK